MRSVTVLILLPPRSASPSAGMAWLEQAREVAAERTRDLFMRASGEATVTVVRDNVERTYGERLRTLAARAVAEAPPCRAPGLIVIGGGSIPLARLDDALAFINVATAAGTSALANSYYSADAFAVSDARILLDIPDLPSDNAVPRWLAERAGIPVADLRDRQRLAIDIDSPLDVLLIARDPGCPRPLAMAAEAIAAANPRVTEAITGVAAVMTDRRAELVVAGRTSSRTIRWLERNAACRIRALVEERGLRASSTLALGGPDSYGTPGEPAADARLAPTLRLRPPRSVLGLLLGERGPDAFGEILEELGDAAIVDTRVLLAHCLGADEAAWPLLADRLASDLLRPDEIVDPWLRDLTVSATTARIPILLGGHTLVGPGLPLIARRHTTTGVG